MSAASTPRRKDISTFEFTVLIALLMSTVAMSIDAMLPALGLVTSDLNLSRPNDAQYVISTLFLGLALGQLICGPYSDALGRKKILYVGTIAFAAGSMLCFFSHDLRTLLIGRFVQGIGIAGPYVSSISIVRDKYSGRQMARIMSLVMTVLFLVPAVAPSLGQLILFLSGWRGIFILYVAYATLIAFWIYFRINETLPKEKRISVNAVVFLHGFRDVISSKATIAYTVCIGCVWGGFIGYLNSSRQIFQLQFHAASAFALYFGLLALILGMGSMLNSRLVERLGMHYVCMRANLCIVAASALFLLLNHYTHVTLCMFMIYASILFFCFGLLFGNLNSMAMESMGHVAGTASAIIGSGSSVFAISIGTLLGQIYNNTLMPLSTGMLILGALSTLVMHLARRYRGGSMEQAKLALDEG
ncbi:multidrug effflux MFS transporter [Burkholderia glumae]|uniref:multidrug effflux MFS transporter n=1 Tax=Burkholderia glumae TaxID=337 RepID=UPI00039F22D3|nr:multidrug effflux MFS transporter [Burkholderia glumae]MCM2496151.1 multidrug effflux MFS transporter [Burkholderia glumae]